MTVTKQEIGMITNAIWQGDGADIGLMGLAYPGATGVYHGTNPDNDISAGQDSYNPFFWTAAAENVMTNPCKLYLHGKSKVYIIIICSDFSVTLNRGSFAAQENSIDPNLGYLAFGGIAPVGTTNTSVTTSI